MAFSATISIFYVFAGSYKYYNAIFPVLLTSIFFILFYAVCQMRRTIKSIAYSFPNERLMCIHFINFPIWILLIAIETILGMIAHTMDSWMETANPEQEIEHMKILFASMAVTNV